MFLLPFHLPGKSRFPDGSFFSLVLTWTAFFVGGCFQPLVGQSGDAARQPKPVPPMQAIPLPYDQVSLQHQGVEKMRFHFANTLRRPFVFPIQGPSGRSLTRMGHPHDPVGHSHHNSFWVSHYRVNGFDFWGDRGADKGVIRHDRVEKLEDGDHHAAVISSGTWLGPDQQVLLKEKRRTALRPLEDGSYLLLLDLHLQAVLPEVTFGKTPFGLVGVRMAKTLGVHDGGGRILNSEGSINEEGVFWKPAKWVDYAGLIAPERVEGITLMDHPANPNHPTVFHVRNDGWMGASLTFHEDRVLQKGEALQLRYGLLVHAQWLDVPRLDARYRAFAELPLHHFDP